MTRRITSKYIFVFHCVLRIYHFTSLLFSSLNKSNTNYACVPEKSHGSRGICKNTVHTHIPNAQETAHANKPSVDEKDAYNTGEKIN